MVDRRIVVVGDVIDDIVVVPRGPIRRDTDTVSSISMRAGGSAANTAAWLGSLAEGVDFVGIVGAADRDRHAALLAAHGVRPHLAAHPTLPTGTIVVLVEGEQRAMLTERGANAVFDPDAVPDSVLAGCSALLVTGHSVSGETTAASLSRLVARAVALDVPVFVAPGSAGHIADFGAERFRETFTGATGWIASLGEAEALTGESDPESAALALGGLAVVTMGGDGVVIAEHGEVTRVSVPPAPVVDPTGAGDAFTAGFLGAWVDGHDAVESARAGAIVAARALSVIGGRPEALAS